MLATYGERNGFLKNISKDALCIWPATIIKLVAGFLVSLILGKYLEPEEYGVYISCYVIITYIALIVSGWLQNSIIRFVSENRSLYRKYLIYTHRTLLCVLCGSILFLTLVYFFSFKDIVLYFSFSLYLIGFIYFSLTQSLLRSVFNRKTYSFGMVFYSFLVLGLLPIGLKYETYAVSLAAASIGVSHIIVGIYQYWNLPKYEKSDVAVRHSLVDSLKYTLPVTFVAFMVNFLVMGDKLVIALANVDLYDIGIYGFWTTVGIQVSRGANSLLLAIVTPWIFRIWGLNQKLAMKYVVGFSALYIVGAFFFFYFAGLLVAFVATRMSVNADYFEYSGILFVSIYTGYVVGVSQIVGKVFELLNKTHFLLYILVFQGVLISFVSFAYNRFGVFGISIYVLFVVSMGAVATILVALPQIKSFYSNS